MCVYRIYLYIIYIYICVCDSNTSDRECLLVTGDMHGHFLKSTHDMETPHPYPQKSSCLVGLFNQVFVYAINSLNTVNVHIFVHQVS